MKLLVMTPCWMKIGAAAFALIFMFNWPGSSGEWAAWVQAVGVIAAVIVGFASSALERRRAEIDRLQFLCSAVRDVYSFLEVVKEAMEVRDPGTGVTVVSRPHGISTESLRVVFTLIAEADLSSFPFEMVKQIRESVHAATEYADAFEKKEFEDVREALQNSYKIHDIQAPLNALKPAIDAIDERLADTKSKHLFAMN